MIDATSAGPLMRMAELAASAKPKRRRAAPAILKPSPVAVDRQHGLMNAKMRALVGG